jgi:hypothetical protein
MQNILGAFGGSGQTVRKRLHSFFGRDPMELPISSRRFVTIDLPNLQMAIQELAGPQTEAIGYVSQFSFMHNTLRELLADSPHNTAVVGPVQFRQVEVGPGESLSCIENGMFLSDDSTKVAIHVRADEMRRTLELEVMAPTPQAGGDFIARVREHIAKQNVYRGKVLSLEADDTSGRCSSFGVRFHQLPEVRRDQIILPQSTLDVLERNTVRFFEHAPRLLASGRSAKRGLLLYGKPGTGKTFTARWLAQSIPALTVLLMAGEQLWLVKECCQIARMLAPTLIIMEDVDLIATARDESKHPMYQVTLHNLLNEMDGINSDAPVLFLLTTNRPEAIEPAIASRPGRIDQAIEYPLPDADCRKRLIELYGNGLVLELEDLSSIIARTEGASPAFIQEMLRKAALIAAEADVSSQSEWIVVRDEHCHEALRELLLAGGGLTRSLLGFPSASAEGQ